MCAPDLMDGPILCRFYSVFDAMLDAYRPEIRAHIVSVGIDTQMYLFPWLQTLLVRQLPRQTVSRVWDSFLTSYPGDGTLYMFKVSIAILDVLAPSFLDTSFENTIQLLTLSPTRRHIWEQVTEERLFSAVERIHVPEELAEKLTCVVHDAFFFHTTTDEHVRAASPWNDAPAQPLRHSASDGKIPSHSRRRHTTLGMRHSTSSVGDSAAADDAALKPSQRLTKALSHMM